MNIKKNKNSQIFIKKMLKLQKKHMRE
jgi:hypothetical protein